MNREKFCRIIADTADSLIEKLGVDILFTVSQIMDMKITKECVQYSRHRGSYQDCRQLRLYLPGTHGVAERIGNSRRTSNPYPDFLCRRDTPMININAYPKSAGFLRTIGMGDWTITFDDLSMENLTAMMMRSWEKRENLRNHMRPIVDNEKKKARDSVGYVSDILDSL